MQNKKEKSTLLRDAIALFLITLISGLALSYVYEITKAPIEKQQMEKKLKAYQTVLSDTDDTEKDEELSELAATTDLTSISPDYARVSIDEVIKAYNKNNEMIGYIINVTTSNSYKDPISLTIGYNLDGTVTGIEILSINETAGLGMKANEPKFKGQFSNKLVNQFVLTKIGATEDDQVDAISGATITSKAVTNAVNTGIGFLQTYATDLGGGANE